MSIAIPILFIVVAAIIGMPIWLAFLVGMIPYFGFIEPMMPAQIIMQQFIKNAESASLLAIPLFVTSGVVMNYAGLSRRLMDFADAVCRSHECLKVFRRDPYRHIHVAAAG